MNKIFLSINTVLLISSYGLNLHAADANPVKLADFSRPNRVLLASILRDHPHAFHFAHDVISQVETANKAEKKSKECAYALGSAVHAIEMRGPCSDKEVADFNAIGPVMVNLVNAELDKAGLTEKEAVRSLSQYNVQQR
jgi:hypothetical protein